MITNFSQLEYLVNGKACRIYFQSDIACPEAKEALFQAIKYVGQVEDSAKTKAEQEEQKPEETSTESIEENNV